MASARLAACWAGSYSFSNAAVSFLKAASASDAFAATNKQISHAQGSKHCLVVVGGGELMKLTPMMCVSSCYSFARHRFSECVQISLNYTRYIIG